MLMVPSSQLCSTSSSAAKSGSCPPPVLQDSRVYTSGHRGQDGQDVRQTFRRSDRGTSRWCILFGSGSQTSRRCSRWRWRWRSVLVALHRSQKLGLCHDTLFLFSQRSSFTPFLFADLSLNSLRLTKEWCQASPLLPIPLTENETYFPVHPTT
jgi:hypothetical protein